MERHRNKTLGIVALVAALIYVVMPWDLDKCGWYGYVDDFFVFMAGYTFFFSHRSKSTPACNLMRLISGCCFIIGMIVLIALILFTR